MQQVQSRPIDLYPDVMSRGWTSLVFADSTSGVVVTYIKGATSFHPRAELRQACGKTSNEAHRNFLNALDADDVVELPASEFSVDRVRATLLAIYQADMAGR